MKKEGWKMETVAASIPSRRWQSSSLKEQHAEMCRSRQDKMLACSRGSFSMTGAVQQPGSVVLDGSRYT